MFGSKGILHYSPKLIGTSTENNWWLVIDCDPEIGKYTRHLFFLSCHRCHTLQKPAWKEHISIIRNEEPFNKDCWKKYEGNAIVFYCEPLIYFDDVYCWFNVTCPQALDIRKELGLGDPIIPLHLTVGNTKGEWHG